MLKFEQVHFSYGRTVILPEISFSLEKGEVAALIGANGAGKSTVSRLCNGLLLPGKGRVLVKGQDTRKTRTSTLSRTIGFLFQNPDRQICKNTVREELAFSLQIHGMEEEEVQRRVEEALERFRLQPDWEPFSRSRGERQRIALASVLIGEPELIILDEPTTGLDYRECTEIMEYVAQLNREKQVTVLMVSHDMELVQSYAQRVLVLSGGQLLGDGPVKQIMKQEDILHAARVLPAQIPALALRFGDRFRDVYTVEEMVAALEKEGC
ncbi:MAG: energy-coupling factor ABC transporter ATP-binding protein [Candidatus Heritagella sp.]